jgi:hypothetical protein
MMSTTNPSFDLSKAITDAKHHDSPESVRMAGHRAHFGINLIRTTSLPVRLLSPNSKKRFSVSSVIVNAIQISTSPSTECCEDKHRSDTTSVATVDTIHIEKKVHFDLLPTEEFEPNPLYLLDDETIPALWYSDDDYKSMKSNRDIALSSVSDNQNWKQCMDILIHFCVHVNLQSTNDPVSLKEKAKSVLPEYRGLEVQGLPILSAMRRKHMNSVLMHVSRIPKKMPEDLRDRIVAARSLEYSRPFTNLALILAQADAREAQLSA